MSKRRYTANSITDAALDALYANANRGWRRGDAWKARAVRAEAAVERITRWCDQLDENTRQLTGEPSAVHPVAANVRQQITPREESTTP